MLKTVLAACALLCVLTINAEARQSHKAYAADPGCNVDSERAEGLQAMGIRATLFPCQGNKQT